MWACMMLLHSGPPAASEQAAGSTSAASSQHSFVLDPSMEETMNLSNNLVMVTQLKRPALDAADAEMQIDSSDADHQSEVGSGSGDPVIVEKVTEALRTCHTCQLATSLTFKPNSITISQLREAVTIGKEFANKAAISHRNQVMNSAANAESNE